MTTRTALIDQLRKVLPSAQRPVSQVERDLATVASNCGLRSIYTTNFDNLIECALGHRGCLVEDNGEAIRAFDERIAAEEITGVFHLSGDMKDPKITEDDLRGPPSLFLERLRNELLGNVLVMIGYSFRDDAITLMYDSIRELLLRVGGSRNHALVMPIEERTGFEFEIAQRLWKKRCGLELIPLRAGEFLRELVTELQSARYNDAALRITKATNQEPAQLKRDLSQVGEKLGMNPDDVAEAYLGLVSVRTA